MTDEAPPLPTPHFHCPNCGISLIEVPDSFNIQGCFCGQIVVGPKQAGVVNRLWNGEGYHCAACCAWFLHLGPPADQTPETPAEPPKRYPRPARPVVVRGGIDL